MSLRSHLVAVGSVCLFALTGPDTLAYEITTNITYTLPTETLEGYSRTRKEYWDGYTWDYCAWYRWDETYGMQCEVLYVYFEYATVHADLFSPMSGNAVHAGYVSDYYDAVWEYSLAPTPTVHPNVGPWTGHGAHYSEIDVYLFWCPDAYWCYGPFYEGTQYNFLGSTVQQATVCTSHPSVIDAAAVAFLGPWPEEAWESGANIYCAGDPNLPLEYREFRSSFSGIHPTDDPCTTYSAGPTADTAGNMHSHPWFSALTWQEEMSRGLGCGGSVGPPITFSEYFYVRVWLESEGAEFSAGDRSSTVALGKPGYLKVAAGNVIKKLMPDMTESQVWP